MTPLSTAEVGALLRWLGFPTTAEDVDEITHRLEDHPSHPAIDLLIHGAAASRSSSASPVTTHYELTRRPS